MNPNWNLAGRLFLVETIRTALLLLGFWCNAWLPQMIPWQASLALYVTGMLFTHVVIYREKKDQTSMVDLKPYIEKPGIPIVVLTWPLIWFFIYGPVRLEAATRQRLGLPQAS